MTGTDATAGPQLWVPLRSRPGAAVITATVFASMVSFLDANVVNVAVPAIGREFDAGVAALQWTLTGYLLTVAALLLVAGALADRFGRHRMLVIGLVVMLASSVLCAVAPSIGTLIAARVVQGAGAALVVPTSLALLNGTLRPAERSRGIGIWAGLATIGTTVGPYAGGALVDHASWRWVFLLNLPLIGVALLALRYVPENAATSRPVSLDAPGVLLAVIGLGGVVYALTEGSVSGWGGVPVLAAGAIGLLALAALLPVERRSRAPMLRLSLFGSRQFDVINVSTVLLYGALAAAGYLVVVQCQLVLGYSAAQAGAALIPYSVIFLTLSPLSGVLVARIGPRWLMTGGMLTLAAAIAWLSTAQPGTGYATTILPGALLWGLGLGLTVTPLTAAVLSAVSDADLGEASAVNDAAARLGAVIAVAAVPALIGAARGPDLADSLAHGYQPAMLILGGVCVVAALITGVLVSNGRRVTPPVLGVPAPHRGCALPVPDGERAPGPSLTPASERS
jgi:EmrB/QacA subfamily drug resistance transporter